MIGSASYSIAGGRSAIVKVKLTGKGKSLLARAHNHRLKVNVTITPNGGHASRHSLTLIGPRKGK